jgi:PPOX class probable F420-dependent enzyme
MFDSNARAFLEKPLTARLATNGPDGYPHVVPLWYILDGDDIITTSERKKRKVYNLQADPRAAFQIGGGPGEEAGYLIRGTITISDDVGNATLNRMTYHYESKEEADKNVAEWASLDMVILRMKVESVVKT